jgi:hypothetical protein
MAKPTTNAAAGTLAEVNLESTFRACGSSPEDLRQWVIACRRSARWALDAELYRTLSGRGYDARALCARELAATLADVTVCDLLQTITLGTKDAIIDVFHGALTSRIWCSKGEIVDALSGRLKGEAAVYRVLSLEQGEVLADFRPVRRRSNVGSSTRALILESLRRKDECAVIEKRLGGLDRVYKTVVEASSKIEVQGLKAALLDAFEPGTRIDAVLTCSSLDDLTVLQAINELVDGGRLVPSEKRSASLPRIIVPVPANMVPKPPRWLARLNELSWGWSAVLVLAALGLGVLAATWALASPLERDVAAHRAEPPRDRLTNGAPVRLEPDDAAAPARRLQSSVVSLSPRDPSRELLAGPSATYPVHVVVDPPQAELWLDGKWVAAGELAMEFIRDGRTHELRIAAADHRSQTFVFRDASPPRAVILEPETDDTRREPREAWPTDPL